MKNYTEARKNTTLLMEMVCDGEVDRKSLIQNLLNWMSEDEVTEFMENNGYLGDDEE